MAIGSQFARYINPLLSVLKELGGSAKSGEAKAAVAEHLQHRVTGKADNRVATPLLTALDRLEKERVRPFSQLAVGGVAAQGDRGERRRPQSFVRKPETAGVRR